MKNVKELLQEALKILNSPTDLNAVYDSLYRRFDGDLASIHVYLSEAFKAQDRKVLNQIIEETERSVSEDEWKMLADLYKQDIDPIIEENKKAIAEIWEKQFDAHSEDFKQFIKRMKDAKNFNRTETEFY